MRKKSLQYSTFSYKAGKSFLHLCPAWVKILLLPLVSIVLFQLPPLFAAVFFLLQMILAFCLRFTLREQLLDLRPILYYAFMLFFVKLLVFIAQYASGAFPQLGRGFLSYFSGEEETLFMLLRLLCVMQTSSIVFKTSTSLQLREGLEKMELAIRGVFKGRRNSSDCRNSSGHGLVSGDSTCSDSTIPRAPVADVVALFVCFIPQVSKSWQQIKRAWKARGGKSSIRMYMVLLPILFSVGMKNAYNTARALSVRRPDGQD